MSNSFEFQQPDPQALLSEVMKEESRRGRFKIFLGYAPGVGKTYKMLEHARIAKDRGIDVVVGVVETHGRAETEKLIEGLEIIARRQIDYKNVALYEMDIEAIIKRRPQLVLVDELAHTNAPGSQYEKRYQDIEILLANKINVYTTVNIQHIESLNDTVAQITGVRIRETVPDNIFDKADEIDVVDIPLEQLQERLKEGKVYAPDLAGKALENYFKRGNLLALRELAFRRAANKLDQELINYMKARGIAGPWATSERLLVCIGVSPFAKKLVRKAYQMASELKAEWYAVYVETPGHLTLSQKERINLTETLGLAQELGAKVITLTGSEIGQEIVKFANKEKVSKVVIGKPVGFFLRQMLARSPVFEILKESGRFDLYFIAPESEEGSKEERGAATVRSSKVVSWKNYFLASLTILPVTAAASLLFYGLHIKSLIMLFILAPMASAFFFGIGPSLFVSILCPLIYDYFFTEPYFSLTIQDPSIILELVIFVVTAVLTGQLANLIRRQQEAITSRLGQMELLSDMGKELLAIPNLYQLITKVANPMDEQMNNTLKFMKITVQEGIAETILRYMERAIHLPCFVILRKEDSPLHIWAKSGSELSLTTKENAIVEWIFAHNEPAGKGTKTLEGSDYFYLPISSSKKKCLGVIGISSDYNLLLPNERILISAINNFAATALENLEIQTED